MSGPARKPPLPPSAETPTASGDGCADPFCAEHSPLMRARVRFWVCPVQEHRERRGVVTVEWRDGIACCTEPTCANTSSPGKQSPPTAQNQPGAGRDE